MGACNNPQTPYACGTLERRLGMFVLPYWGGSVVTKKLTIANLFDPREAAFVAALFDLGGPQHATEAALRAGYSDSPEEAAHAGALLLGSSRISRVIRGEIMARLDVAAAAAFNTLLEVCANKNAPASARISAAQEILNRSSLGPPVSRSAVLHGHQEFSIEDLLERLDAKEAERQRPFIDVNPIGSGSETERESIE